ncbi:MAG: YcxB family protein [Myxococcota bacterium]
MSAPDADGPIAVLEVPVSLSVADVRHGFVRTLLAQTPGLRVLPVAWTAALAVLAVGLLELAKGTALGRLEGAFLAFAGLFVVGVPAVVHRVAARGLAAMGGPTGVWRFRADALQVQVGRMLQTLHWENVHTVTTTRRAYLVHPRPGAFHVLPRAGLDTAQTAEIEAFLAKAPRARPFVLGWMSPAALMSLAIGAYLAWTWLAER